MREAVLHLSGYQYQNVYGVNYRVKEKISMGDLAFRVQHVIRTEIDVTISQLNRNNIQVLVGYASFLDPHTVRVTSAMGAADIQAEQFIIATGTKPAGSPKVPINGRNIINSDQILTMPQVPRTLIVVGGGVIGSDASQRTSMMARSSSPSRFIPSPYEMITDPPIAGRRHGSLSRCGPR
jgi:NAD(P) transhydrogenase